MSIQVKRRTANYANLLKLKLYVDGERVGKILSEEDKKIDLPSDKSTLQIKQLSGKSNEVTVQNGDVIKISLASWLIWAFAFLFVGLLLTTPLSGLTRFIAIGGIAIVYLLMHQIFNVYELTKVDSET